MDLKAYLSSRREMVDAALERLLPADENGGRILEAMRYSIFAGGKRLRPILCLAGAEAVGGDPAQVMFCACAMEMVHTYSLIHDDLPAMDDDEFRRGVPTSHMVYGEGMAVLAGDGLLTQAMVLLSDPAETAGLDPSRVLEAAQVVMKAAGYVGMVGGQAVDLASENLRPDLATVQYMHAMKTGALITASVQSGAILAGGDADQVRQLVRYGRRIGLAFQIADDLLDLEGDFDALGKTVGADQARGKMTYPAVVGPAQARSMGQGLVDQAAEIAESLGPQAAPLAELARYIMARTH
ncbi:MAG: polyprenyl synthetase family protein [Proteobacteria bacterium]|nr:polyprenyl synthetase family protein [Pseudomonadota bacterium]MBU4576933.1 polyprenyl synthetase family protein [Pseudomonadota bacterium]